MVVTALTLCITPPHRNVALQDSTLYVMLSCVVGCVHVGVCLLFAHQKVELVSTRVAAEIVLIVQSSTVVELFVLEEANK